ncbi:hypothetical protein GGI42DRAFT_91871 [Trichoderma sp. SZMC 28013]
MCSWHRAGTRVDKFCHVTTMAISKSHPRYETDFDKAMQSLINSEARSLSWLEPFRSQGSKRTLVQSPYHRQTMASSGKVCRSFETGRFSEPTTFPCQYCMDRTKSTTAIVPARVIQDADRELLRYMMSAIDAIPQTFRKAARYLDERAPQGGIEQRATNSHSQSSTAGLQDLHEANRKAASLLGLA